MAGAIFWTMHRLFEPCSAARRTLLCFLFLCHGVLISSAGTLDTIGLGLLRGATTNLHGSGVGVAQVEAPDSTNTPPTFQVNPSVTGQPVSRFTYFIGPPLRPSAQSTSTFPNSLGGESGHAGVVARFFYGVTEGVSTNVAHVDNYEANYFFSTVVPNNTAISDRIVNQTFIVPPASIAEQQEYDSNYDNYAATHGTLFISGAGNVGTVKPPATSYNGIAVGAFGGASSIGPTADNGRAKPDIVAPADVTSFSTPRVSGSAAILLQAAVRGDGGANTNAAADARTLKALLLNGAIKPADWNNPEPSPLDPRYGSGVLNVFNSYNQLLGGRRAPIQSNSVPVGTPHPPLNAAGVVGVRSGYDFNTVASSLENDGINHYYFELADAPGNGLFTATVTLVWNRQSGQTSINNLEVYLYHVLSGGLVAASTSVVDNVEHIYIPQLPQGRYDLQVLKRGGAAVSLNETYALAFDFAAVPLSIEASGGDIMLRWPDYPAGFVLQSAPNLNPPILWSNINAAPVHSNRFNTVVIDASAESRFFRLQRP